MDWAERGNERAAAAAAAASTASLKTGRDEGRVWEQSETETGMWCDVSCERRKRMEHFVAEGESREEEKEKSGRKNKRRDRRGREAKSLAECLCHCRADFSYIAAEGKKRETEERRRRRRAGRFVFLPLGPFLASGLRKRSRSLP